MNGRTLNEPRVLFCKDCLKETVTYKSTKRSCDYCRSHRTCLKGSSAYYSFFGERRNWYKGESY